jgi:hypothetical protein
VDQCGRLCLTQRGPAVSSARRQIGITWDQTLSKTLCRAAPSSVSGSTYQATCTTMALPAGSDTITTAYPGDASYATSPGTLT